VFLVLTLFEICNVALLVAKRLSGASYMSKVVRLGATFMVERLGCARRPPNYLLRRCSVVVSCHQAQTAALAPGYIGCDRQWSPLAGCAGDGAAGSGKSSMSRLVLENMAQAAASSGAKLSSLAVCGADLLALGNGGATDFLNNLICIHVNQSWRCEALVRVVDDAEQRLRSLLAGLIALREKAPRGCAALEERAAATWVEFNAAVPPGTASIGVNEDVDVAALLGSVAEEKLDRVLGRSVNERKCESEKR
jgi:hypothetical protein